MIECCVRFVLLMLAAACFKWLDLSDCYCLIVCRVYAFVSVSYCTACVLIVLRLLVAFCCWVEILALRRFVVHLWARINFPLLFGLVLCVLLRLFLRGWLVLLLLYYMFNVSLVWCFVCWCLLWCLAIWFVVFALWWDCFD